VGGSKINLSQENTIDFWTELQEQLGRLLTATGKESLTINKTAGLIQVTDRPSALLKIGRYLQELNVTVGRQVEIEAKLFDVTLGDQFQFGIDWQRMVKMYGGTMAIAGTR